jgi:hypothetical protein
MADFASECPADFIGIRIREIGRARRLTRFDPATPMPLLDEWRGRANAVEALRQTN